LSFVIADELTRFRQPLNVIAQVGTDDTPPNRRASMVRR
jgi:hypothetical protein